MRRESIDETGKIYGRLTVIERAGSTRFGAALWLCGCQCGNKCIVRGSHLRNNRTRSCGCFRDDLARERLYAADNYKQFASERTIRMWASRVRQPGPKDSVTGKFVAHQSATA
jgi:hypothetical protein